MQQTYVSTEKLIIFFFYPYSRKKPKSCPWPWAYIKIAVQGPVVYEILDNNLKNIGIGAIKWSKCNTLVETSDCVPRILGHCIRRHNWKYSKTISRLKS